MIPVLILEYKVEFGKIVNSNQSKAAYKKRTIFFPLFVIRDILNLVMNDRTGISPKHKYKLFAEPNRNQDSIPKYKLSFM